MSVIIAVYNGASYLEGAIESVLNQTYKNYEIIIIDGNSKDESKCIINKYSNLIKYGISETDSGIYDAWNKGLRVASGDWIVFIGADDILFPDAFQKYINYINKHPDKEILEFVSSKIELIDENINTLKIVGEEWKWVVFREKMITWHVGSFHSKQLFKKYGLFDETFKICGDYEFLLRPKDTLKAAYLPIITVRMRNGGVSSKLLYKSIDETYKAKIKNNLMSPCIAPALSIYSKTKVFIKKNLDYFTKVQYLLS